MKTVEYSAKYKEAAPRKELLIRLVWAIPCSMVSGVLCFISTFTWVMQFFHILLLGSRHKTLNDWNYRALSYHTKWMSYTYMLTDEQSPIFPED